MRGCGKRAMTLGSSFAAELMRDDTSEGSVASSGSGVRTLPRASGSATLPSAQNSSMYLGRMTGIRSRTGLRRRFAAVVIVAEGMRLPSGSFHTGPPPRTVDTTIFEMWLGSLSTHRGPLDSCIVMRWGQGARGESHATPTYYASASTCACPFGIR